MKIIRPETFMRLADVKDTRSWWRKNFGAVDWVGYGLAGLVGLLIYANVLFIIWWAK